MVRRRVQCGLLTMGTFQLSTLGKTGMDVTGTGGQRGTDSGGSLIHDVSFHHGSRELLEGQAVARQAWETALPPPPAQQLAIIQVPQTPPCRSSQRPRAKVTRLHGTPAPLLLLTPWPLGWVWAPQRWGSDNYLLWYLLTVEYLVRTFYTNLGLMSRGARGHVLAAVEVPRPRCAHLPGTSLGKRP
jgi:hypothetical protein